MEHTVTRTDNDLPPTIPDRTQWRTLQPPVPTPVLQVAELLDDGLLVGEYVVDAHGGHGVLDGGLGLFSELDIHHAHIIVRMVDFLFVLQNKKQAFPVLL